jgi:hypothetical protein
VQKVYGTSQLKIGWGYGNHVEIVDIVGSDRSNRRQRVTAEWSPVSVTGRDESAVDEASARRSALDAQAVLRKERADRQRRLGALAVAVLTAPGERDAFVRDAEWRARQALQTMTTMRVCRCGKP